MHTATRIMIGLIMGYITATVIGFGILYATDAPHSFPCHRDNEGRPICSPQR